MYSSAKTSLVYLVISLILTFAIGSLFGFSYDWRLSPFGSALALFVTFSLFFLGFFGLLHLLSSNLLESNPWVVDANEMDRWFNPMYDTWLFYHDHKKWAKWSTLFSLVLTVLLGTSIWLVFTILSAPPTIPENSWMHACKRTFERPPSSFVSPTLHANDGTNSDIRTVGNVTKPMRARFRMGN